MVNLYILRMKFISGLAKFCHLGGIISNQEYLVILSDVSANCQF